MHHSNIVDQAKASRHR